MTRRQRRRLLVTSAIVAAVATVLTVGFLGDRFNTVQARLTDLFFLTRAASPEQSRFVVLVGIDDKSVVELRGHGRMQNWPRTFYADVVRSLVDARARTIVFDILFDTPAPGDDTLAEALGYAAERSTVVLMPSFGDPLTRRELRGDRWDGYGELFQPLPRFNELIQGAALVNQLPDPDGTVRRYPLVFEVRDEPYPSLGLLSVAKFLRRPTAWDGPIADGSIPLAGRQIPIDERGAMIVNYPGGPHDSAPPTLPVVSFVDLLNGRVPPETFERKLVLIGATGTGFADDYWTPASVGGKMDGVEIHAQAIDTILGAEFMRAAPRWQTVLLIWLFAGVSGLTLVALPTLIAAVASVLGLAAFVVAASYAFDHGGTVLNLVYPPLAMFLTYSVVMLHRVIFEQGETRALRGVLGQYLSPSVMAHVTRDPDQLKLGGDEREMTVMFADLRGFTTFSEMLDPETLVATLNEYLTAMSEVIFKHEGTIDKYMGDAVMAFWGAPQAQPAHAECAVRAGLEMIAALKRLNADWGTAGRYPLAMGIGISTGIMKVGNMGSASRFDYTVLGDAVNLGSRLEGLNKEYGTSLIVSAATLAATNGAFRARFLDLVAVKGKKEPVEVYEILADRTELDAATEAMLRAYEAGTAAYRGRDWLGAAARFQEALRHLPGDGPSALYLQRCESLIADPPPADWDGVYVMTRK
ncbi:MAG: adenylate/guanylate cyclase domain-containing protein [Chloroflexota bacterium]|nr:adenylate/guanylate cyclase domain-containing protein [Chloroflexota bacterium]